jgi:protein TonB
VFDNYVGARLARRRKWMAVIFIFAIIIHAIAITGVVIRSLWSIKKLEPPDMELALSSPPPPPPPPPAGAKKPKNPDAKKIVRKVKETVQPEIKKEQEPVQVVEDEGVEGGVEGGQAGGVLGGVEGGVIGGVEPPKPEPPKVVPQVALEAQRISGEKDIQPPNDVATQMARSGKGTVGVVKMCLTEGGTVKSLTILKSTTYPAYDNKIKSKMHEWRYRPFQVNGKAVPVCTSVTFIYRPR